MNFLLFLFLSIWSTQAELCQKLLVPSYYSNNPTNTDWNSIYNNQPSIIIVNPENGPNSGDLNDYEEVATKAHSAGIQVVGYVYTKYGSRSINSVLDDVNTYYNAFEAAGARKKPFPPFPPLSRKQKEKERAPFFSAKKRGRPHQNAYRT